MTFASPTLRLELRRSRCLASAWLGLHGLGLLALWLAALATDVKLLGSGVLLAGCGLGWRRHCGAAGRLVLIWSADGSWTLAGSRRAPIRCERWTAPWVHPQVVLLRFELGRWRRRTLALCADSLPAEQHRALRLHLRVYSGRRRGA